MSVPLQAFVFDGEWPMRADTVLGPSKDFNVMVRRSALRSDVCVHLHQPRGSEELPATVRVARSVNTVDTATASAATVQSAEPSSAATEPDTISAEPSAAEAAAAAAGGAFVTPGHCELLHDGDSRVACARAPANSGFELPCMPERLLLVALEGHWEAELAGTRYALPATSVLIATTPTSALNQAAADDLDFLNPALVVSGTGVLVEIALHSRSA